MPSIENWIDTEIGKLEMLLEDVSIQIREGLPIPQKGKGELVCNLGSITPQCNDRNGQGSPK